MSKIYISAPRSMKVEAESLAKVIEAAIPGAVVGPRWFETVPDGDDRAVPADEAQAIAQAQAVAVLGADAFIYLSAPRGDGQGTHTELGLALAGQHIRGGPVVIGVGRYQGESIFNRLTTKWVATWVEVVDALREVES